MAEKDLQKLKYARAACKATVTRIQNYVMDPINIASTTVDILEARKDKLVKALKAYEGIQLDILNLDSADVEDVGEFEEKFFTTIAKINETIRMLTKNDTLQTTCISTSKLPNVDIPSFDGKDFTKFKPFFELFMAVIDNNKTLTDVQKLFYLRTYLKEEALSVIVNLPIISTSYKEALHLLRKRYDNKTRLICNHINLLLDIPTIQKGTAASLRTFVSQVKQQLHALKNFDEPVDTWDRLLLCVLSKKLDLFTHRAFHLDRNPEILPTMAEFLAFLEKRAMALEDTIPLKGQSFDNNKLKPMVRVSNFSAHSNGKCIYCNKTDHAIFNCPKFKTVPIESRLNFVNEHKLCSICLKDHASNACKYKFKCKICKLSHNTLLHCDKEKEIPVSLCSNSNTNNNCNILLPTVKVRVTDKYGQDIFVRALLDSGSQASFVTSALVSKLKLAPSLHSSNIIGIGNKPTKINQVINLPIYSSIHENIKYNVNCCVVDSITAPLPQQQFNILKLNIPKEIQIADDKFNIPSEISMLLGADIYFDSLLSGCLKLLDGPVLQNTVFGYVVAGKTCFNNISNNSSSNLVSNLVICDERKLEDVMEKFWLTEKVPEQHVKTLPLEFERAQIIFNQSLKIVDNTFHVDMPLICQKDELELGDSFSVALQRFLSLEQKFKQNPILLEEYSKFIEQYIALGHAREVDINSYNVYNGSVYFLAHHAVFNEHSKTTKLRVVFDGSMKSKSKKSLNDMMLNGPVVQGELFDILLLFRTFSYVLICDIEKMFRCIYINEHHRSLQNILWRDEPGKPIRCLQLQTVTYGLKSSTFLATRCLAELAYRYANEFPLASKAILENTYIDDVIVGADTVLELQTLKDELIKLLDLGSFKLHKWCSNHTSILEEIPPQYRYFEEIDLNSENIIKTLGLKYDVVLDNFYFQIPPQCGEELNTKRKILSYISKIFDPLGIIGPIVVVAKMIMQDLWSLKLEWDDVLPTQSFQIWERFLNNLKLMGKISVPRFLLYNDFSSITLVGFSDASLKAYGCCLYLRVLKSDGSVQINLLCSKSRVAPLSKTHTIPQLELNSALLLAQLTDRVSKKLSSRFKHAVRLFSDSQIVLAWIQSGTVKSNIYVNNRVQQIANLTDKYSWSYVRSCNNPADLISRGVEAHKLKEKNIWWHGPQFLLNSDMIDKSENSSVPVEINLSYSPESSPEEIPCLTQCIDNYLNVNLFEKFSNLNKLQNVIAYIYRFFNNVSKKQVIKDATLTPQELEAALLVIVRSVQREHFSHEISSIVKGKKLKSGLASLHPFIDALGVLRVGGRLQNAGLPRDKMHPIILPKNSNITSLLIEREHLRLLHAGPRLVLSSLSQKFWIINGIRVVKKVLHKCLKCARMKAETARQLMGSLPAERITASRPFQHVGLDFCGPFSIKVSRTRKPLVTKGYVALFVCFCTKAIHAEVVSDLTTATFLACFDRFIARRGMPTKVFCDNAKTFKGAENQLKELYNLHSSRSHRDSVYNYCNKKYIKFMYIPSYSPEFGGLWEAGVKSVKHHLKRTVGTLCLTYEEFNTVIVQIEGVLNSRPLLSNPSECGYLTPGHFLVGTALTSYPEVDLLEIPINRLKFWKVVSKLKQDFWRAWSRDYLNQLQSRPKWKNTSPNLKEGDIVLVKNINTPPLEWPMARIVKVFPGKDNNVRVAENAPCQDPVYRKVAIVENFFDIIYTVHVELEGRPGKHAGQKRTYRTITETYAFLPREAVTRFLTGCAECARRPRSASPPPLPTPSPSPTRHPTYLSFLPHCAPDYSRNWESEIDAAHSNFPYEPKYDYTDLQPLKKIESPKAADAEDPEPTYIELTSKKINGFDATFSRSSSVDQAYREDEPVRTEPEIDKDDNSLIDVEDVRSDSPPTLLSHKPKIEVKIKQEPSSESTRLPEDSGVNEKKTEVRQRKYNPLDVANLTSKDPPKSRSPPRKKLLPTSLEYTNGFGRFPKPWRPDGGVYYGGEEMDYSVPITTAYLKHMRSMAYQERMDMESKDNLTPEPSDMNDDDNFSSQAFAKDAEKLKMMLLAWNYHSQPQGRNGDITESGADSMADLWASYHSALGLGSKPPKPPTPLATGHSSPIHIGSATPVEPASTHDETSSSDRTKDDDDGGASDDDSDDRVDPQHHDPERLKAFNMFVRLFVDENLDRIVPISKQPKEKIQAIIDSCTRQFPEFAERARKRIRTYLKSCRRNKKVRGDGPTTGNGGSTPSGNWDTAVRPTPAHLTSVQAEHILAQACENESLNAKRMRLGLDPVSQPMPTVPTPMSIDTTATSAVASSFLSLYSGAMSSPASTQTTTSTTSLSTAGHSKAAADTTRPSASPTMENPLLNNNSLKIDNANGNAGSKTASPASSPAPLFRPSFPNSFGTPQTFGRASSSTNPGASALSSSALLSTLSALPPTGVNAAMAAYQSALLSAMAAHTHTFPTGLSAPTDLSLKNTSTPAPIHSTSTASSLSSAVASSQTKSSLLSHKLSGAEVGAVRQLITGYRESAAFLLRSADELEALLLNQA